MKVHLHVSQVVGVGEKSEVGGGVRGGASQMNKRRFLQPQPPPGGGIAVEVHLHVSQVVGEER